MIYEYAVILQPKYDKDDNEVEAGKIVVEPTTILAKSDEKVAMIAARAIPDDAISEIDRLTVVVRPFA